MPIKVAIRHQTSYTYDRLVNLSPHTFRLKPAAHCRTPILSYSLKIEPSEHFINWQQDPFGNFLARVVFPNQTTLLRFEVEVIVEIIVINPFDFFIEDYAEKFPFSYTTQLRKELLPYFEIMESGPRLTSWLKEIDPANKGMRTIDVLVSLNQAVQQHINYSIRMEPGVQTCEQTLILQNGSCRDSAWLRDLYPVILYNLKQILKPLTDPQEQIMISPTCMPGRKFIYPVPDGLVSTRPRGFLQAKVIFRCVAHQTT